MQQLGKPFKCSPAVSGGDPGSQYVQILHVITDLAIGGAELMMERLVENLAAQGRHRQAVISLASKSTIGPRLEALGVEVEALGMHRYADVPSAFLRLRQAMARRRPDLVQTWMYPSDLIGGVAARLAGVPRVVWNVRIAEIAPEYGIARSTIMTRRLCARLSSRVPDRIVYVAESARRSHEAIGYDPARSVFIPNGYRVPAADDVARWAAEFRQELGVGPETVLIGSAGRYNKQKDFLSFIRAAAIVAAERPDARFVMMGRNVLWSNRELARWVRETGHADRFFLLGKRYDLVRSLSGLDLFCLHSLSEGLPNVVAEAMSAGVPTVVTDVGDAAVLVDGTGVVVAPGQPEALAAAICDALRMSTEARRALGLAMRERIARDYSMEDVGRRYADLYDSLDAAPR